jgi:hypothetical protein
MCISKDFKPYFADLGKKSVMTKPSSIIRASETNVRFIAELMALSTMRVTSGTRLCGILGGALVCIFWTYAYRFCCICS